MRTERVQTLADGIFAIALTLLVLELPVPEDGERLGHDLVHQWPFYAACVVSSVTITIVWINHHALMDGLTRTDRTLVERSTSCCCCSSRWCPGRPDSWPSTCATASRARRPP